MVKKIVTLFMVVVMFGLSMNVDTDPAALGQKIVDDFKAKRKALGWE